MTCAGAPSGGPYCTPIGSSAVLRRVTRSSASALGNRSAIARPPPRQAADIAERHPAPPTGHREQTPRVAGVVYPVVMTEPAEQSLHDPPASRLLMRFRTAIIWRVISGRFLSSAGLR